MTDAPRPPLPKYAKYFAGYEPSPRAAQRATGTSQSGSGLHVACILISFISGFTTAYLLASLIIIPNTPARPIILVWVEVTWAIFGLLPGLAALICWSIFKTRQSTQSE